MNRQGISQDGFTLVEVIIVITVLIVLAAIVTPAVSGIMASFRTQGKQNDMKNVEAGVSRYRADHNNALPIIGLVAPVTSVQDINNDGIINVKVNSTALDPAGFPADSMVDVICGDGSITSTMPAALAQCFGAIDFSKLAPNYVAAVPKNASGSVTATASTNGAVPSLIITRADSAGDGIQLYLDAGITANSALKVWNVDASGKIIVLRGDTDYGKP